MCEDKLSVRVANVVLVDAGGGPRATHRVTWRAPGWDPPSTDLSSAYSVMRSLTPNSPEKINPTSPRASWYSPAYPSLCAVASVHGL